MILMAVFRAVVVFWHFDGLIFFAVADFGGLS
jgi:hypothetical protein